jgi:hypothetical protein
VRVTLRTNRRRCLCQNVPEEGTPSVSKRVIKVTVSDVFTAQSMNRWLRGLLLFQQVEASDLESCSLS